MGNLAEQLRPTKLEDVVAQDNAKRAIKSWTEKDDFPRCQLYIGPVGTGKSTLAEIVSRACQGPEGPEGADIRQINAGTVGKVDDMRALAADSASRPFIGRYRVFILEEFQRATDAAQDAILVPMEVNPWTVWILTSSDPSKILPAVRSRCAAATFELKPLKKEEIWSLINSATNKIDPTKTTMELLKYGITSPREILGVLDQILSGVPLEDCIHRAEHEPLYKDICGATLRGDWAKASGLLSQVKTADSRGLVSVLSAFLRGELLKNPVGPKADALATALVGVDNLGFADGTAYGAAVGVIYKTCKVLEAK